MTSTLKSWPSAAGAGTWMDRHQIAKALGVKENSIWQMVRRGKLAKPARVGRDGTNHPYSLWSATQLAEASAWSSTAEAQTHPTR